MEIAAAVERGDVDWFKRQKEAGKLGDLTRMDNHSLTMSIAYGHLDLTRWLVLESGQPVNLLAGGNAYFDGASDQMKDFLIAMTVLDKAGFTLEELRKHPVVVSMVESGSVGVETLKSLSANQLEELQEASVNLKKQPRRI